MYDKIKVFVERYEKILFILIFISTSILHIVGISHWLLANIDEVSALNQLELPFLSGACTSTNYLLTTILLKTIGKVLPFPFIRLLTALVNLAALYLLYSLSRSLKKGFAAFVVLMILGFSWNMLYYSRIFEVGSFTPSIACFFMWAMIKWIGSRKKLFWLYIAAALVGFHFNTHAMPSLYAIALLGVYLLLQVSLKKLAPKVGFCVMGIIVFCSLPYIYSFFKYCHFGNDLSVSYGTLNQKAALKVAVNFLHPLYYLKTLAEYMTYYPVSNTSYARFFFAIMIILAVLIIYLRLPREPVKDYLAFFSFGSLLLIGLSPIPVYNEGHLHFFWPHFVMLLALLVEEAPRLSKIFITLLAFAMLIFNCHWLPQIFENQVRMTEVVLKDNLYEGEVIYISDGAELKLRMLPLYSMIKAHPLVRFSCYDSGALKTFQGFSPEKPCMIITTSDCPWPPWEKCTKLKATTLLSLEQLFEAQLSHGLRIYKVEPTDR